MKRALLVIVATGCARGGGVASDASQGGDDAPRVDAPEVDAPEIDAPDIDAPMIDAMIDAPMIDAMIDAPIMIDAPMIDAPMIDAPMMVDAPMVDACVPAATQLLVNPAFDASPRGTGWSQNPIDSSYPIITGDDGPPEQTAPYKAWLGGIESGDDSLHQNVTIPANTTQLVLTGYYFVASDESSTTSNVYDTSVLALVQTNNTNIATVLSLSNRSETTAWIPFSFTFAQNLSGQTVRLRVVSDNDTLNATSFWFDTLALTATHCP